MDKSTDTLRQKDRNNCSKVGPFWLNYTKLWYYKALCALSSSLDQKWKAKNVKPPCAANCWVPVWVAIVHQIICMPSRSNASNPNDTCKLLFFCLNPTKWHVFSHTHTRPWQKPLLFLLLLLEWLSVYFYASFTEQAFSGWNVTLSDCYCHFVLPWFPLTI